MKHLYSRTLVVALSILIIGSCTKETTKTEQYNPNIRIYGVWRVVTTNATEMKDFKFIDFSSKKVMHAYLQSALGFKSDFEEGFVPTEDAAIVDLYNSDQTKVVSYSISNDTLILTVGGVEVARSVKASSSDVAGWVDVVAYTETITGLFTNRNYGIGFDGVNLLIPDYNNKVITKLNLSTRLPAGDIPATGSYPYTVEFDGSDLWVSSNGFAVINKHPLAGGSYTASITTGAWIYGIAYDPGNSVIIAYSGNEDTLYFCNKGTNKVISTKYIGPGFKDLAWSNGKLFLTYGSIIYRFNTSTMSVEKAYKIKSGELIQGIAAVGNDFWVYLSGDKLAKVTLN